MELSRRTLLKTSVLGAGSTAVTALPFGIRPAAAACAPTVWTLWAGQTKNVGTLTVTNDATNIYVTYTLTRECAAFGNLHLWVGNDLTLVPAVKNGPNAGTPIPGKFPYQYDASGTTTYTFTIPFTALSIQDVKNYCGATLYVVAHAEVNYDVTCDDGIDDGSGDTAFGGDVPINVAEPGRWWYYGAYTICCDFTVDPPPPARCTTAFGRLGMGETYANGADFVFTTDSKSNPEKLPSLNLIKNRWGWAIKLTAPGTYSGPIYAGAGLNKVSNAKNVGTLTIAWNGATVTVAYQMNGTTPAILTEVHVYAGATPPTTTAPGQYGYTEYFDPANKVKTHTVTLDVEPDGDTVWIIAHAVVCY